MRTFGLLGKSLEHSFSASYFNDKFYKEGIDAEYLSIELENIKDFSLFIGSHNEFSNTLAVDLMKKNKIEKNDEKVWFSQLYGMSDNISFTLAKNGYNVAKYLPFGPIKEVIPYLIRRLDENSAVSTQTNRELRLISIEIKRRNS